MITCMCSLSGCGDGGGESGDGGAASASPRVEEPPPVPPAGAAVPTTAALPVPPDVSPTADSWEAEADDALLTPEDINEPDEEETDQQVQNPVIACRFLSLIFIYLCKHCCL